MNENSDSNEVSELEWIRLRKEILNEETSTESRFVTKFKENPFIPVGALATTACLVMGIYNMTQKRSVKQQFYMRARVFAQGFTVAALILGIGWNAKGN